MNGTKYYGKYRGVVVNNIDPEQRGRILANVPDMQGFLPSSWCMPCAPVGGLQHGFFAVPPPGAGVWVEFEQGNIDYPIWSGCFWDIGEIPATAFLAPPPIPAITMQTVLQNAIQISDVPGPTGGILLKSATGATITINETGILISNGQGATILLAGPSVTINAGALVVT
jgi:uncharacterized protein involved in type VI secretion and phage assembly